MLPHKSKLLQIIIINATLKLFLLPSNTGYFLATSPVRICDPPIYSCWTATELGPCPGTYKIVYCFRSKEWSGLVCVLPRMPRSGLNPAGATLLYKLKAKDPKAYKMINIPSTAATAEPLTILDLKQ